MTQTTLDQKQILPDAEPRWKELYTIGGITSLLSLLTVVFGIIAYILWPYMPGYASTDHIFSVIHNDPLAGLMGLDFFLVLGNLFGIPLFLAFYVSLKRTHASYALLALVLGLTAAALIIPSRPILELFKLSDLYNSATSQAVRSQYLAAGDALRTLFDGTSWAVNTLLGGISFLISATLMLRSPLFSRAAAWVGIISNIAVLGFWIPGLVGALLLFLSLPGYLVWYILLARHFFRAGKTAETPASSMSR